ncbi:MAG: tetratricopeptide repeat protein [Planctomycetota bacterium]|nr:tetratricopeptide repeat protein [Planctomycetota bacterium]
MNLHGVSAGIVLVGMALSSAFEDSASAQETEAATRQFAAAVGFQNQKLYDLASEEWQTFLKKYPDDQRLDKAQHYLGTCLLQEKKYEPAVRAFESVVAKYPKFDQLDQSMVNLGIAWYGLAQESKKPADFTKAEKSLQTFQDRFPKSPLVARALYYRGESLYQQEQLDGAAKAYAELIQKFPQHELTADAVYALGVTQEALKQTSQAEATFADFSKRFPNNPLITEVRMRQAEMLFESGDFAKAKPIFDKVSTEKEFHLADVAMLRAARCLYEEENYDESAKLYWRVPREFQGTKHYNAAVLAGSKCYFLVGKYAIARSGLEQVVKRNGPEAAEALQWMARSYMKEEQPQRALELLDSALGRFRSSPTYPFLLLAKIDAEYEVATDRSSTIAQYANFAQTYPKHELAPQAQYTAALTALDVEDYASAKKHSDTFLTQYPNDRLAADVLFISAESRLLQEDFAGAEQQYRNFLTKAPQHASVPRARVRQALALHMAGKFAEAVASLEAAEASLTDPTLKSEAQALIGRGLFSQQKYEQAAAALEKSIATRSDRKESDETMLVLADAYRQLNRGSESTSLLKKVVQQFPDSSRLDEAEFRLGEAAYELKQLDVAIAHYTTVIRRWPEGPFAPHAQYGLGWTYFNAQEFVRAIEAMSTLLERFGKSEVAPKGYYVRAMANYQIGELQAVINDVQAYLLTKPKLNDAQDARYVKGLALAGLKKFDEAATEYEAILKAAPNYAAADKVAYELAWAHVELGRQEQAVAAFQKLVRDYPSSPLAAESLFRVGESWYEAGDFVKAVPAYKAAYEKAGKTAIGENSLHKLAWSYLKAEQLPQAGESFAAQLDAFPNGDLAGDATFLQGECWFKQQKWEAAAPWYDKVIASRNPQYYALSLFRTGECAGKLESWKKSQQIHEQVLADFPDFELRPEARYGVGWALQNQGQLAAAMEQYEKVTDETQTETAAKARFMIGECCFAQKQHKEATRHFLKAAYSYGHKEWSPMAFFEAGRCFEVLRDTAQAKNCYQQLVEKYPEHSKVRDAQKRVAALGI